MAVPTSYLTWRLCCEHGDAFVEMLQLNETSLSLDFKFLWWFALNRKPRAPATAEEELFSLWPHGGAVGLFC